MTHTYYHDFPKSFMMKFLYQFSFNYSNLWRLTWKHSLTALRSIEEALSICLNPCLKGSTLISFLCLSESSISFFLTHWIPRCWNSTVISSELTCKVHTPRLQPSFPTYNKCERIWIACWINKKVVSWRQKYSKKELNVLWMVEQNSFVSWCLMRMRTELLTLAGLTRLCGWALGISVSCVTQLTTTTAFLLVPTIWIFG